MKLLGSLSSQAKGILPLDQVVNRDLSNFSVDHLPDFILPNERVVFWGLPSHGIFLDSCGTFFMKGCLNLPSHPDGLGAFKPAVHCCYSPKCPVCSKRWMKRGAQRIEDRILASMKKNPSLGKPIHVVASVPSHLYSMTVFDARKWVVSKLGNSYSKIVRPGLRSLAQKVVKKAGFRGGCSIYHPFRQDPKTGLWVFSPHFHFLGFGWIDKTKDLFQASGWVVKNLGVRNNVFGTAFYQLTHCGVWYGSGHKHNITWFGDLSYAKLKVPGAPESCCPWCGEPFKTLTWTKVDELGSRIPPPLPCSGIDDVFLASSDGWVEKGILRLEGMIPRAWVEKYG